MYVTWKLNWDDPNYGTGPEAEMALRGSNAGGIIADPDVNTGTILGRIDAEIDLKGLEQWGVQYITNEEALAFAQKIAPDVTMGSDGNLVFPALELPIEE